MSDVKSQPTISRRAFIAASAAAAPLAVTALASPFSPSATEAPAVIKRSTKKQNVLFICCDDLTPRIHSFGDPVARTPNLDRLAQRGVRFERNYCQYPLCGPSRSSLMTGLAPDTTRVWDLNTDFREALPEAVTLPQLFQKNGYFTARAGKIYHYNNPSEIGTPGFDDAQSWQASTYPAGYDRTHDESLVTYYVPQEKMLAALAAAQNNHTPASRHSETQVPWVHGGKGPSGIRIAQDGRTPILPLTSNGDLGIALAGHGSDGGDERMTDYLVAESAIAMIEEHRSEPWFIASGFFRPHVPFIVPSKYFDMYNLDDMQLPSLEPDELTVAPRLAYLSTEANFGMNAQQHREAMRAHFAAISFVDAQVGRLLDALDRLTLSEETTVVFWSDHGFMVGEHGQWEKTMLFDASLHTPLIIAGAGVPAKGGACAKAVEHLNIFPTLAELCNLNLIPANLQGRSMVGLLSDPDRPWDHPAISQVGRRLQSTSTMGYSLRTERYRYTLWGEGGVEGEELYDYHSDPQEKRNLARDADSAVLKVTLRAELQQICQARRGRTTHPSTV